ncbi:hypothetical protein DL96DRAFT_1585907 [Flagelloscypha sp. PMI_526]|nr:hypothetical protein DL96DRAFT_1585907 [Flagelloscypha sp. PMI_526]
MASPPTEVPTILLPTELQLRIFEICFIEYPDTLESLFLVSRRTFQFINSIRFFSMTLTHDSDVKQITSWIQTQPPGIVQQGVKTMLISFPSIHLYSEITEVVEACQGVQDLALWLPDETDPFLDSLVLACLKLPNVSCLSLNDDMEMYLHRFLSAGITNSPQTAPIAFMQTLRIIDWATMPTCSLGIFPRAAYTLVQVRWPCSENDTSRMEEWLSLPSSKGLVLLLDDEDLEAAALGESTTLSHRKVVLASAPKNWVREWEKHCFGDEDVIFTAGKRFASNLRREDRIWRR